MKLIQYLIIGVTLLVCLVAPVMCHDGSYILSFDESSRALPQNVWEKALGFADELGVKITHEYSLIKGFTLDVPEEVLPKLKKKLADLERDYGVKGHLEEDNLVHAFQEHI